MPPFSVAKSNFKGTMVSEVLFGFPESFQSQIVDSISMCFAVSTTHLVFQSHRYEWTFDASSWVREQEFDRIFQLFHTHGQRSEGMENDFL